MRFLDPSKFQQKGTNEGFTLIEVLVAIFIGLIVMGMAVAILGVTNSVSIRVLSKSESQQNIRNSVVKLLDNVSNASSLETCRIATNSNDQTAISGSSGTFSGQCKEFVKTGNIIAWAAPNKMCYFDKRVGAASIDSFPDIRCISRGGPGIFVASQGSTNLAGTSMNIINCVNHQPGGTDNDPDLIYLYSCTPSAGSRGGWPSSFNPVLASSESVIADIGLDDGASTPPPPIPAPIFNYRLDNSAQAANVMGADLTKIVAVRVDFEVRYRNNRVSEVGRFKFNQTIILRESKKATEEEYNG